MELKSYEDQLALPLGTEVYIIYGKENCQFCEKAKTLLESEGIPFRYFGVGKEISKEKLIEKCSKFGVTPKTVPQIFKSLDDVVIYIGGYTELVEETI